jgi:hypothetical protein
MTNPSSQSQQSPSNQNQSEPAKIAPAPLSQPVVEPVKPTDAVPTKS